MRKDEEFAGLRKPFSYVKACLLSVLAVLLVAGLPLTAVYSLKAQLRDLAKGPDGARYLTLSDSHRSDSLPYSVAVHLDLEALVQRVLAEVTESPAAPFLPAGFFGLQNASWRLAGSFFPDDDQLSTRRLPRFYDPLAPPHLFL